MFCSIQPRLTCSHPIPTQPVSVSCVGLGVSVGFGGVDGGGCRVAGRFGHIRVGAGGGSDVGGVGGLGRGGGGSDEVDDDDGENKLPMSKYDTRTIKGLPWTGCSGRADKFEIVMERAEPGRAF